jgi:uncharacterized protein YjbJ (UPF0337 family)
MKRNQVVISFLIFLLLLLSLATAEEWIIYGPRALGMGGAGVAMADPKTAFYWNPAALAWNKGIKINAAGGIEVSAEGDILKEIDDIVNFQNDMKAKGIDINQLKAKVNNGGTLSSQEVQDLLVLFAKEIPDLDKLGQGVIANAHAGLSLDWNRFAITLDELGYFGGDPVVDLERLSFTNAAIVTVATTRIYQVLQAGADHTADFTNLQSQNLADQIVSLLGSNIITQNQAEQLVYYAEQANIDTGDPRIQDIIKKIVEVTAAVQTQGNIVNISANQTGVQLKGLLLQEFGASYGYPLFGDTFALGLNLKGIQGETFYKKFTYSELEESDDLIGDLTDKNNRKTTTGFGVDAGILYAPINRLRLGVVARNINEPSFDYSDDAKATGFVDKAKVDTQVRAGAAYDLVKKSGLGWTLAVDGDLTDNKSNTLEGFKSQMLSLGTELQLIKILALRAGAFENTASDITGWCYTAGFGLHFGAFGADIAGAMSPDKVSIESDNKTEEVRERYALTGSLSLRF